MLIRYAVLAVFAAMTSAVVTPTRAADTVNVVTPSRVIFALPFWIAERKGYFKDENIEAKIEMVPNGRQITQRLLDGTAQFSIVGPDATLINATSGGPLRIVAGVVRKPPLFLITSRTIRSFSDLRGARIGVLSLTEGSSKLLVRMLKAEGVAANETNIAAVGGAPKRQSLLQDGSIDAGMQPLPLNFEAEAFGLNNLGWAGKYEPEWQFTTVNANGEWARKNSRIAVGFLRALLRGQQLIWSNPDEAALIAADSLQAPAPMAIRALEDAKARGMLDPKLNWSALGLQRIYEGKQDDGQIPKDRKFDLGQVSDVSYLQDAQRSLESK